MNRTKSKKSGFIHLCISLMLMIVFRLLPPIGGITPYGMAILGIFLGTIYGWVTSDIIWPGFLALVALVLTLDFAPSVTTLFSTVMSNSTVVSIIAAYFVSGIVVLSGVAEWIGRWFISRPMIKGRPYVMVALIFGAGLFVCPFIAITWIMLMYELIGIINQKLGYENKSIFTQIMLYSIVFTAQFTIYLPMQVSWILAEGIVSGVLPEYSFGIYPMMPLGFILIVLLGIGNFLALKLVFKPDLSGLRDKSITDNILPPPPMNQRQKISLVMVLAYLSLLILAALLPSHWAIVAALNKLGVTGLALLCAVLAMIIHVDGKPLASFREITGYMSWSIVFMVGIAILLASALTAAETGITATLSKMLTPLFSGFSPYLFTLVILIVAMVLTNLINNIVVLSLLTPIVVSVAPAIGCNINAVFPLLCYAIYMAIMLPSASPIAALLHSNTKQMDSKLIIKFSMVSMVASAVIFAVIGIPLANLFY